MSAGRIRVRNHFNPKFPVFVLVQLAVRKDNHRTHGGCAGDVGYIIALDPLHGLKIGNWKLEIVFRNQSDVANVLEGENLPAELFGFLELKAFARHRHLFFEIPQNLFLLALKKKPQVFHRFEVLFPRNRPNACSGAQTNLVIKTRSTCAAIMQICKFMRMPRIFPFSWHSRVICSIRIVRVSVSVPRKYPAQYLQRRSEERRVGKEWRPRWSPY